MKSIKEKLFQVIEEEVAAISNTDQYKQAVLKATEQLILKERSYETTKFNINAAVGDSISDACKQLIGNKG